MAINIINRLIDQKKSRLGIDIGSYSVKVIELSRGDKNNNKIKNIGYAAIESPSSKERVVKAIKSAVSSANTSTRDVTIAVSGPSVIARFIELPHMTATELSNAIPFEAEKYIPFGIHEVIIDHQLLIPSLGNNQMLVLLVAVKKDYIDERLSIVGEAGLSVNILDVAAFANVNSFISSSTRKNDEIAALIDIGARAMDINIIDSDVLYFTRSIQLGGEDATKVLSEALSVDIKTAENIKLNPGDKLNLVREKTEPILRNMMDEARLSFSYYENQSGKNIEKLYLTGGGSQISGLYDLIKEGLGLDAVSWNPVESIEIEGPADTKLVSSIKNQLGVSIGLALR